MVFAKRVQAVGSTNTTMELDVLAIWGTCLLILSATLGVEQTHISLILSVSASLDILTPPSQIHVFKRQFQHVGPIMF